MGRHVQRFILEELPLTPLPVPPPSPSPPLTVVSTASVALVDVRSRAWPVLYANESFARDEGGSVEDCTAAGLWDLFEPAGREGKVRVCV
jgi:hypothetical protein